MARGPRKKHKIMLKVTIEGDEDDVAWVLLPPTPKVAGTVESPFTRALAGIIKEMKVSQKSSERIV